MISLVTFLMFAVCTNHLSSGAKLGSRGFQANFTMYFFKFGKKWSNLYCQFACVSVVYLGSVHSIL